MEKAELKKNIGDVLRGVNLASLATIVDGRPWVRYVMTHGTEDFHLYVNTFRLSRKVAQIRANPHVHLTLGASPDDMNRPYLNIAGTAEVLDDEETKRRFWSDDLKTYFSGPDDPDYCLLKIVPSLIEYAGPGSMEPLVYRLSSSEERD